MTMWKKLTKVMLGIILVIIPTYSHIVTRLFPVTEEISTRIFDTPVIDTPFKEEYSPKVVYPLPPGVTPAKTSFTEATFSTNKDLISNDPQFLTTTSKASLSSDQETLPNNLNPSIDYSSFPKRYVALELKQGQRNENLNLPPHSSTEEYFEQKVNEGSAVTQKIYIDKETTLSTDETLVKAINSSSTAKPDECMTPMGKNGECIDVRQCPSLVSLIMHKPLLSEDKLYLQQSQCGFNNKTVLACCPYTVPAPIVSPKLSLLPKHRMCGSMNTNRLYGGYTTEIDAFSWMALLEYAKGGEGAGFHCGGALINDRYVLTAAHCVSGLPATWIIKSVRLGEYDLAIDMDCSNIDDSDCIDPPLNVPIEEIIPHKDYLPSSKNQLNDIALIRLSTQVNSTDFVEPVCLAYGENILHAFDDQSLDLVGWGASVEGLWNNVKQKTNAQVIKLSDCRSKYAEYNIALESSQFCVEGRLRNDTCRIDSGGPLVSFDTANKGLGRNYLAGIQSFSQSPCWMEGLPGVYTRVADYLDWILENIRA